MKAVIIVLKVLFLGALFIVSNHNLYLNDGSDREVFYDMYTSWLSDLFSQGAELTGYLIKSEWLPYGNYSSIETIER